jgi:hypothetical protein
VPIRPFLDRDDSFGPEDIAKMSAALEAALGKLGLVGRSDPVTMAVAKQISHSTEGSRDLAPGTLPRAGFSFWQSHAGFPPIGNSTNREIG